jgi:pimeloyl-ACP methyl ester carboxylesterase
VRVVYLHGFASSAQSSKAAFFREKLQPRGIRAETPDLNGPDFSTLTITRMLDQVHGLVAADQEPVVLIGSSLGGFVALHAAVREASRVARLVLLAPALDFGQPSMRGLGDRGLEDWRRTNSTEVFHHAYGRMMTVHYELFDDASRYDSFAVHLPVPTLVFQGRLDTLVDAQMVEDWARPRDRVRLRLFDDDHQLHASLEQIWTDTAAFLGVSLDSN